MEDKFIVEYTVKNIVYRDETSKFSIFQAKKLNFEKESDDKNIETYIVKGCFEELSYNDRFRSTCKWSYNNGYGWQLEALSSILILPSSNAGIKKFLCRFIKGLGLSTAEKIVSKYGEEAIEKIKESEDNLTSIPGIGKSKAEKIRKEVLKHDYIEKLSIYLFSMGLTNYNDVLTIYSEFKEESLNIIKSNPYIICDKISINLLNIADTIALNMGLTPNSSERISKILQLYLNMRAYTYGDLFVCSDRLRASILDFIAQRGLIGADLTENCLNEAIKKSERDNIITKVEQNNSSLLYLNFFYDIETEIASILLNLTHTTDKTIPQKNFDIFFRHFKNKHKLELGNEQMKAVIYAATKKLLVITGGAGVGKTSTVNAIIEYIKFYDPHANIVLTAPTGRAAKRLNEVTKQNAYTIHRLLNLSSDTDFYKHTSIEADYLIVDECSMIDTVLFYKLLKTACNSNSTIILVGDKEQLPPVGPGLCFKEIVESKAIPTVRLNKLYRQANESQIYKNAIKILNGVSASDKDGLEFDIDKQDFFFFPAKNPNDIKRLILASINKLIEIGTSLDDIIVMAPMKKSLIGTIELNKYLQEHLNPYSQDKCVNNGTYNIKVGDRVMQLVNNYSLNVFNGDLGKVIDIDAEKVIVEFEDYLAYSGYRNVTYEIEEIKQLSLAYAITIHKAQGSEFPCVIFPIDPLYVNLSRNILYTALTRAKKRAVLIGSSKSLYDAISKTDVMNRNTNLSFILRKEGTKNEESVTHC